MRVIISAGGTGGHIYPALAIIEKIKQKEPNSEFLYIGTHNRMENEIVPKKGIPFESIEIYGFNRKKIWKNIKTIKYLWQGYQYCKKRMLDWHPDIVIGVGGYVTAPVIMAAKSLKIKTFIHEQNSVPGASNNFLKNKVDKIGVSFKTSLEYFPKEKTIFTGNPCGEHALNVLPANKKEFNLSDNKKLVLFVMGSLGSSKINEFLLKTMSLFQGKEYEILFVTGKEEYEQIQKNKFPTNVKIVPYIDNMTRIMKKTDIIVSRAGASTLSEIIALQIPSILIPSPYVPNNHQYKNALDLITNKAAVLVEEKDLNGDILVRKIDEILNGESRIKEMKYNLKQLNIENSAEIIYKNIKELIDRK